MDATKLTLPVGTVVSMAVGLLFIYDLFTDIKLSLSYLQNTHDKFEYEVKIVQTNNALRLLETMDRSEEQQRAYERLQKAVVRYEAERDKLL